MTEQLLMLTESQREYVLGRLDRDHIAQVAEGVCAVLADRRPVEACYQPGDATWYSLTFVPLGQVVGGGGGGTHGWAPQRFLTGSLLVVYGQRESIFVLYDGCDPEYAAAHLTDNLASALAIAELLREVVARKPLGGP